MTRDIFIILQMLKIIDNSVIFITIIIILEDDELALLTQGVVHHVRNVWIVQLLHAHAVKISVFFGRVI